MPRSQGPAGPIACLNLSLQLYNNLVMTESLTPVFSALADPTRQTILERLRAGEASASALAEPFAMSQPAVSRHLKVLERAGLITHRRSGTRRMFRIAPHRLAQLESWLETFRSTMEANYARLDALLYETDTLRKDTSP